MRFPGKKTIRVRNRIPGLQLNSVEMYSGVYSVCLRTKDAFMSSSRCSFALRKMPHCTFLPLK